jgi:hypothetical protein
LLVWGCAHAPPPPPPPASPANIHGRHFDQVCHAEGRPPTEIRLAEIVDTAGLVADVSRVGVQPLPLAPPWPLYDFVVRYGADGRPEAVGTWDATVDEPTAAALEAILRRRTRTLPPLLEPAAYRTQVRFARRVTVELQAPSECIPHLAHPDGGPPYGMQPGVTSWGAAAYRARADEYSAIVRIRVADDGAVLGVDSLAGNADIMARTRAQVARLRFDPALRNGLAVEGELIQGFSFRRLIGRP